MVYLAIMVENKRLGAVLNHIQQQHEKLEQQNTYVLELRKVCQVIKLREPSLNKET